MPGDRALEELAARIGHDFARIDLLERAVTHSSFGVTGNNNQRLEFLGDRVLGLVLADCLINRFPDEPEGDLAKRLGSLADGRTLATIAGEIELSDWLRTGEGDQASDIASSQAVLADALEAVIGAVYLDGELGAARGLVERLWERSLSEQSCPPVDSKTALQEWVQARSQPLPEYNVVSRTGPDHAPEFTVEVSVSGLTPARASSGSKRSAEQKAAAAMLDAIDIDR
jgi:ribonuclease-3